MKRKPFFLFLLSLTLLAGLLSGCSDTASTIRNARNGVVRIWTYNESGGGYTAGCGTGFGIGTVGEDTDTFITNWHVVTNNNEVCDEIYVLLSSDAVTYRYRPVHDERTNTWDFDFDGAIRSENFDSLVVRCEVVYATIDLGGYPDFAIIRAVEPVSGIKALPLMRSEEAKEAEQIFALGYPAVADKDARTIEGNYSYEKLRADVTDVLSTSGRIVRFTVKEDHGDTKTIMHEAHINNGNSGGPLLNENGAVIGINTYKNTEDSAYAYSVYTDYVMDKLDELGIHYDVYTPKFPIAIVAAVAAVVLIVLAAAVLVVKQHSKAAVPVGAGAVISGGGNFPQTSVRLTLYAVGGELKGRSWPLQGSVTIGRDGACTVQFSPTAKGVSRQHCRLSLSGNTAALTDLQSTYGTYVNGQRLAPGTTVQLQAGEQFYLGDARNTFVVQ